MHELPLYTKQVIFQLQVEGIFPVLAHPERYWYFFRAREVLLEWAKTGILMQLDLGSFEGIYGHESFQMANWLLKKGLVNLIGTDAHRPTNNNDYYKNALHGLLQRSGPKQFEHYLKFFPQAIIGGCESIPARGKM